MTEKVRLAELTREEIRELAPRATVVLPTAAIEQHGPHLPIVVDTAACQAVCERAAEVARAEIPIVVAPILPYGYSEPLFPEPGVLSLTSATFLQVLSDLGRSLVRSGFRRIAIINGHGPNDELIRVAARDLHLEHEISIAAASYWTIAWQALVEETDAGQLRRLPGHGGTFETSVTMALRPDLVDRARLPRALADEGVAPQQPLKPAVMLLGRRFGDGPGYTDDPLSASPEAGERYLDTCVRAVAKFLVSFHRQHPLG